MTPDSQLGPGKIYDSNSSMLLASLHEHGFPASSFGIAKDDRESLVDQIRSGLYRCDVLITSGGVSMGEKVMIDTILSTSLNAYCISSKNLAPLIIIQCPLPNNGKFSAKIVTLTEYAHNLNVECLPLKTGRCSSITLFLCQTFRIKKCGIYHIIYLQVHTYIGMFQLDTYHHGLLSAHFLPCGDTSTSTQCHYNY